MFESHIFTVTELNTIVNAHLNQLGELTIEGEISQFNLSQGKWIFMTLKDENASVEVFGSTFTIKNYKLLESGMLVRVVGLPKLYEKSGRFSVSASQIVPTGTGALQLAYEKLKKQLDTEGLFAIERKRPIPFFPERIALVTADNSQAYSDFMKVTGERMGGIIIDFYPVQVQGKESVSTILQSFNYFNEHADNYDLLVLVRGGGSLEDLISFNDEQVVRAIFGSKIPVVCGIGHEKDISLADLVADLRASTPSNAAELIFRDRKALLKQVKLLEQNLGQSLLKQFQTKKILLDHQKRQLTDHIEMKLLHTEQKLGYYEQLLKTLDYRNLLQKGFSLVKNEQGEIVRSANKLKAKNKITNVFHDGEVSSTVN